MKRKSRKDEIRVVSSGVSGLSGLVWGHWLTPEIRTVPLKAHACTAFVSKPSPHHYINLACSSRHCPGLWPFQDDEFHHPGTFHSLPTPQILGGQAFPTPVLAPLLTPRPESPGGLSAVSHDAHRCRSPLLEQGFRPTGRRPLLVNLPHALTLHLLSCCFLFPNRPGTQWFLHFFIISWSSVSF